MALNFPDNPVVGYIYNDPTSTFSYEWDGTVWKSYTTPSSSNIKLLDNISGLFDNNTVSFPLTVDGDSVINATTKQLLISVGGVIQNPTVDFDVVGSNIVFTTAPATGLSFFGTLLGTAQTEQVSVYNKQSYTTVGVQTTFTFSTGYTVGYLDVFRNGVRLVSGSDFTASDGSTFVLSPPAQNGDDIEAVGFNVDSVTSIDGNITNLNVSGYANVVGVTTLNSLLTITSGGANITGVVTATSFVGNVTGSATYTPTSGVSTVSQGLTGTPNISVSNITGVAATFTGNVSIAGTLTYEDVTNVDSVGLITARSGIRIGTVGTASTLGPDGGAVFSGIVTATSFVGSGANLTGIAVTGRLLRAPQVLTSGTSYTTPAGCTAIYVECVGAGGGGARNVSYAGAGGGGGAYAAKYFAVSPSTSYSYTIGTGGSGGTIGNPDGGTGGSTTFIVDVTTLFAGGGGGGVSNSGLGGVGGSASNGDLNANGGAGGSAWFQTSPGANGGSSFFGGAGTGQSGNGSAGGGGGGGIAAGTGGSGGNGLIRIWEYS